MVIKAIIFDMDGVIVDSEARWQPVERDLIKVMIPSWSDEDQKKIVGLAYDLIYEHLHDNYGLTIDHAEFVQKYQGIGDRMYNEWVELIPGVKDFISTLDGYTLAIASCSPQKWIDIVRKRFDIDIGTTLSSESLGLEHKPSPQIYRRASEILEFSPQECVVIEDSSAGVQSAKAAGMCVVGLHWNKDQNLSQADLLVDGFANLNVKMIEGLGDKQCAE